jgi:hypothetical protein
MSSDDDDSDVPDLVETCDCCDANLVDHWFWCLGCRKNICDACYEQKSVTTCDEHEVLHVAACSGLAYCCDVCDEEIADAV